MSRQLRLEVVDGGDILRLESELRSLRKALEGIDGVIVGHLSLPAEPAPGTKGVPALADAALWLAVSGGAVTLTTTAIREWASVQRGRKIRLTRGEEELEIDGKLDPTALRALEQFLERDAS
ncbi:effector-associated constant component EACC1 [Nonomuraea dietziae]